MRDFSRDDDAQEMSNDKTVDSNVLQEGQLLETGAEGHKLCVA